MSIFRVEKSKGYTVMSNEHLRNKNLSLKAKGLLSQMLSLPENWDYTLQGLSMINKEKIDDIREAIRELEKEGYIVRYRTRNEQGQLKGSEYVIYELPQNKADETPISENPTLDFPTLDNPTLEKPTQENPTQIITDIINKDKQNKESIKYPSNNLDRRRCEEEVKEQIEFDLIADELGRARLQEIVNIMVSAICSAKPTIRINGEEIPQEVVKRQLKMLDDEHIRYVLDVFDSFSGEIKNIQSYLLTMLYNAPNTMDNYYTALFNKYNR